MNQQNGLDAIDRMDRLPRSKAVSAALANVFDPVPLHLVEDVTDKIQTSLSWMAADMDFRRQETGLEAEAQSPEMKMVHELLTDFAAGRIQCIRQEG